MSIAQNFPALKPSLLLDFANVKKLDPRISFSRASGATYYDGVTTAKAEENLLRYSQEFDNAAWLVPSLGGAVSVSVNTSVAPDGTLTADRLNFDTVFQAIGQSVFVPNKQNTFSIWLKIDTGTRELSLVEATGAIVATFVVTDQWVRYSATFTPTQNTVGLQDRNGSGFVGVDVWGAQVEQRSSVTAYTPTTTQPITNYIPVLQTASANTARFDHDPVTGESLGLLVEEQRTNLLTYSEDFSTWIDAGGSPTGSIIVNQAISPDGTLTADYHNGLDGYIRKASSVSTSTAYTLSIYAKKGVTDSIGLYTRNFTNPPNTSSQFNLSSGAITQTGLGHLAKIVAVGNDWYRCSITFTTDASDTSGDLRIYADGIYIWGAQLEVGAFPTSYIKTEASQVTRSADSASMTGTNFSSWYRQDEGTLYAEGSLSNANRFASFSNGSTSNQIEAIQSGSGVNLFVYTNGSTQMNTTPSANAPLTPNKVAFALKTNDCAGSVNGGTVSTDTSVVLPLISKLQLSGNVNGSIGVGHYKKLSYYNQRLTNEQLQALTS